MRGERLLTYSSISLAPALNPFFHVKCCFGAHSAETMLETRAGQYIEYWRHYHIVFADDKNVGINMYTMIILRV